MGKIKREIKISSLDDMCDLMCGTVEEEREERTMTKQEIIRELNKMGEFHSDMASWTKNRLQKHMEGCKRAESMTTEELIAMLKAQGKI